MIGQNDLGYKEAGVLARGLLTAKNLLHLECGNNNFSKKGWKEVGAIIIFIIIIKFICG